MAHRVHATCRRIVDSSAFPTFIGAVIVANAIVIGLGTYDGIERDAGGLLDALNDVFLWIFVAEIVIRILAEGRRPLNYFRSGWNVFDFVIIGASFIPGIGANPTLLRLVRLLRVVRLVTLFPDLRVMLSAVVRAIPAFASVAALSILVVYVYGMLGWILFGDEIPEHWGDIGEAMLTLFVLLTLESLPDLMAEAREVHSWSWIYFVSFALTASFLLLNLLIGIIIESLEQARTMEHERERAERRLKGITEEDEAEDRADALDRRIEALRLALDDLEEEARRQRVEETGRAARGL